MNQKNHSSDKGYKQTEVGVIPEDWVVVELDTTSKVIDSLHQTPRFSNDGFAMVRVTDIKPGSLNLDTTLKVNEAIYLEFTKNYRPKRGDIVLSRVGSYGVSSFVDTDEPFCLGQNTVVIEPNVINKYLYYILNSEETKKQVEYESFGSGYKSLSLKNIKELKIPSPPTKAEQAAIADALSDADALIQSLEKLIAKKQFIKQGAMQELLKPKEGWVVRKLGEIFTITAGGDLRKNEFSSVFDEKYCYPIYSNALTNAGLYGYCSSYDYDENCITVTARGTVGYANSRDHKFSAIGRLLILKPLEKLNCVFITEYINLKLEFANESTGVPQLTAPQSSKYEVVIPSYTEQTRIATILSDMDAEISALETKLAKYKQIKQGMMQELLTGKTRLV